MKALYPASFDPVTLGHLDIIKRASKLFDNLFVVVLINSAKKTAFSLDERVNHLMKVTSDLKNVTVCSYEGLTSNFVKENDIDTMVRGIRTFSDYESEFTLATAYKQMFGIETVFLPTSLEFSYVSSSMVKELAKFGKKLDGLVPDDIKNEVFEILSSRRG